MDFGASFWKKLCSWMPFGALVGIYGGSLDPTGNGFRRFLLEEALLLDAVWVAPHHQGTVLKERKNMIRDAVVIREEIALPDAGLRKINFVQMRERERPAVDLQVEVLGCAVSQFLKTRVVRGSFWARSWRCHRRRVWSVLRPRGGEGAFFRSAVLADAQENGRAQVIVFRPVRVFDSRNHCGPHPFNVFA